MANNIHLYLSDLIDSEHVAARLGEPGVWQNVGPGARNPAYMQPKSHDKVSFGWAPSQEKLERARQMAGGSSGGGVWFSPTGPAGYALNRNYSMQELPTSSRFAPVRPTDRTFNTLTTDSS